MSRHLLQGLLPREGGLGLDGRLRNPAWEARGFAPEDSVLSSTRTGLVFAAVSAVSGRRVLQPTGSLVVAVADASRRRTAVCEPYTYGRLGLIPLVYLPFVSTSTQELSEG